MVYWVHVTGTTVALALDALWWVIAMRLATRTLWRVLVSVFMAVQMAAAANELIGRLGMGGVDLALILPKAAFTAVYIWHYFGLPALLLLGLIWAGARVMPYKRKSGPSQNVPTGSPTPKRPCPPEPWRRSKQPLTRRQFVGACAALAPPLFTVGLTGFALPQLDSFRVRKFTLGIAGLPRALDGMTIAHVSDIHVGPWTCGRVLRAMVAATNQLRADAVVVTGDLINFELADLSEAIGLVKAMEGRYGLWMIEGNHDLFESQMEFERRVKAAGLPLLLDESVVAMIRGYPVQLLGLRWMDGRGRDRDRLTALQMGALMQQRQADAFPIILAHHPHAFDAAVEAGLPLTLSGHTHGGQLMLDSRFGVGPALFRYWSGHYQHGRSQMIVSNGVGNMFPLRVNAPAEIVHITLRCA